MTPLGQIVISVLDRARLDPMIRDAVASNSTARDLLCALKDKLDQAQIRDPYEMPGDVVTMNSLVRVRDLDTEEVETYTLVYPAFADIARNRLSILTPVGITLLGHHRGESVEWASPRGSIHLLVEQVEYQPESAGQFDV